MTHDFSYSNIQSYDILHYFSLLHFYFMDLMKILFLSFSS